MRAAVLDWAAWVPGGLEGLGDDLAAGRPRFEGRCCRAEDPSRPPGIALGQWRRMSRLTRMVGVAVDSLRHHDVDWSGMPVVWGSAMGEVVPSSAFLDRLFLEGPEKGSPLAFQGSVYNAPSARLSLSFDLRGPTETVSVGQATGLAALAQGIAWLETHPVVLVAVGDDLSRAVEVAHEHADVAVGEGVIAMLLTRGSDLEVGDGARPADIGRGVPLPYERGELPEAAVRPERTLGLCAAFGLVSLLTLGGTLVERDVCTSMWCSKIKVSK